MKTIEIQGHKCTNFGSNNYSHGMEAVVFNPKDLTAKEVAALPGVFLHPTCKPNSLEIFALLGTQEQFKKFYKSAVEQYASNKAIKEFGMPEHSDRDTWGKIHKLIEELEESFKPWYT